jgi:hypothetical protein
LPLRCACIYAGNASALASALALHLPRFLARPRAILTLFYLLKIIGVFHPSSRNFKNELLTQRRLFLPGRAARKLRMHHKPLPPPGRGGGEAWLAGAGDHQPPHPGATLRARPVAAGARVRRRPRCHAALPCPAPIDTRVRPGCSIIMNDSAARRHGIAAAPACKAFGSFWTSIPQNIGVFHSCCSMSFKVP